MSDATTTAAPASVSASRPLALVAYFVALALFAPVLGWLIHIWSTSVYDAHGALVPFIVGLMILSRRRELTETATVTAGAGLWLVALGAVLLLAALLMNLNLLGGVALVVTLAGMVWTLWGRAVAAKLAFPLGFLLLMLPLNYPLEIFAGFPLRVLSVKLTAALLRLVGFDVTVQGTLIATSQFQVAIESPCSGLKTLSALLMTGLVLAYFLHQGWRARLVLLLLISPVAIMANAIRNMAITLIGHYHGREAAMGVLHTFSGLVVFLLAVALLILFSELILWRKKSNSD
jgi:exosortase